MQVLNFLSSRGHGPRRFLFLGAHCDDVEIGCGGTLLTLAQAFPDAHFRWVVFSSTPQRAQETQSAAGAFLRGVKDQSVTIKDFRNGYFPYVGSDIKDSFERLKGEIDPDVIFTHYRHDLHQDHRVIAELTLNTFRRHLILEYEIPKYDGDLGAPSVFLPLSREQVDRKIEILLQSFPSEAGKHWFSDETFRGLARLRGMECVAPAGYAEAFYSRKILLQPA